MDSDPRPLTTIRRAFEVLDLLQEMNEAGPTELAKRMDIPSSTVYDYLRTLHETGYVVRDAGSYRLSPRIYTMAGRMKYRDRLFLIAKPEMKRIATDTNELVGVTIEYDGKGLILHQEEGDQALSLGTYPGAMTPLHTNAAGKVILAYSPSDEVEQLLGQQLAQRTENTITDAPTLRSELEAIREREYAVDWDEQVVGMGMIAVPIRINENLHGTLNIVAPTGRIRSESYQKELLEKLREADDRISINYRYDRSGNMRNE